MDIGIGIQIESSIFINGAPTCAYALYEYLHAQYPSYKIGFINLSNNKKKWYVDCIGAAINTVDAADISSVTIFIDCTDAITNYRPGIQDNILFVRKPPLFSMNERSIYPQIQDKFYPTGYTKVWCWNDITTDDKIALEVLYKVPVIKIPIIWSSNIIGIHNKELIKNIPGINNDELTWFHTEHLVNNGWTIRTCENNYSQMNPFLLQLFIIKQLKKEGVVPINKVIINNSAHFKDNEFFQSNIHKHWPSCFDASSIEFAGRQRVVDWILTPRTVILSHMRWRGWRPALFDALWMGIPVIHNSIFLKDLHPLFERYYYDDNSIMNAVAAFNRLHNDWRNNEGFFGHNIHTLVRKILSDNIAASCPAVLSSLSPALPPVSCSPVLRIGFINMWDKFNPSANFIIDMLKANTKTIEIKAEIYTNGRQYDIVVAGPFGELPATITSPIVYYSGENTLPQNDNRVILNLGHSPDGPNTIRLPHWVTSINWFNTDQTGRNPIQLPLEWAIKSQQTNRENFAAFVVSNPCNKIRNESFHRLSQYKPVHSGGRLYNNIGDILFTNIAGGGGGEEKKVEWMRKYKFAITYENGIGDGYVTEKLLHAKMAGCIPIYWGDSKWANSDFVEGSFIDCTKHPEEIVDVVKYIDENEELYKKMAAIPPLDKTRVEHWIKTFKTISETFYKYASITPGQIIEKTPISRNDITYISYASQRFIPSMHIWCAAVTKIAPTAKQIIYLYHNITDNTISTLEQQWPRTEFIKLPLEIPEGAFTDYWNPLHYGAKLWLFNDIINKTSTNDIILFMDIGVYLVDFPEEYILLVKNNGIAFYKDSEQFNKQWFSQEFCEDMSVTQDELAAHQCLSAIVGFTAAAKQLIQEAYTMSKSARLLVGPKWAGLNSKGQPYGHRHDQSILSLLALRYKSLWRPLEKDYTHESLTDAIVNKKSYYVHRQLKSIAALNKELFIIANKTYVVNLDRRTDRWSTFLENNKGGRFSFERWSATDGKSMELTPQTVQLFRNNTYKWKKSTMGCADSHYRLWKQLAESAEDLYFVFEDDAVINPHIQYWWHGAQAHLPSDYDILFLGGVLPQNMTAINIIRDPYNSHWSKIKPNTVFGQKTPTPYFHFCTYSYIISKRGAQKLMEFCKQFGCPLPSDHMLINNYEFLNIYFANPLQVGCIQDNDPTYINGTFNDYSKHNTFDSDIWNNNECWTQEDIQKIDV
jgi:GR25 family glycosyltransferase involved in LPS biosynthesis/glycosyltransferase involved in cell wall biosynthesis